MVLSITIADAQATRVIDGICTRHDYQPTINGVPNPETKNQFAKRMLIQDIKLMVRDSELATSRQDINTSTTALDIT